MRKTQGKVKNAKKAKQLRRKLAIRKKIIGTTAIPRICAEKTNKNIRVQVIDDSIGKTLFSVQTFGKSKVAEVGNTAGATKIGEAVAAKLKENKIEKAVFDRNGKTYTGVIATLATAIRENGIQI